METKEHTELGNALRYRPLKDNPYLRVDEKGTLHIRLQRFEDDIPVPMELEMSAGEIIAMAGDFFTEANWSMTLNLPSANSFPHQEGLANFPTAESLGEYLINQEITQDEELALITAYNNLAAPDVTRSKIDTIYKIDSSTYVPFSSTLNSYVQQLMFALRVKNYGEMLNRNQTHFTPWSVRVYTLGHHIALKYARLSYDLEQLLADADYHSQNDDMHELMQKLHQMDDGLTRDNLQDLAHRYHALSLCMEFFTFHYYSDHFAAGHMSMVGDLRVLLTERFGMWGSILANNIHNELNDVGVYTTKIYDPTFDINEPPIAAQGDGELDSKENSFNRQACIAGMQESLGDIHHVLGTGEKLKQFQYGGLEQLPDVDCNFRQRQPLLILSADNVVYRRSKLSQIKMISPSDYEALRADPGAHGYTKLSSKWDAFWLVVKLRVLPFIYGGKIQPVSEKELQRIQEDEMARIPNRRTLPVPQCTPVSSPLRPTFEPNWQSTLSESSLLDSLAQHGLLSSKRSADEDYLSNELSASY